LVTSVDGRRLMRLDSAADSASIAEPWFAPPGLIGLATDVGLGKALVAGRITSHLAVIRFGSRVPPRRRRRPRRRG
jgi:hypothetical protein